jgi:Tetratricopeptide repeat
VTTGIATWFLSNLAVLFNRTGRREEAMQSVKRALDIVDRRLGPGHPVNGILLRNYAALLRESGDKAGARKMEARSTQVLKQSGLGGSMGMVIDISELTRK